MIYNKLYEWQKDIVDKFRDRNSFGIFLDCGLGKSPICLSFAEKNSCNKILIITINPKAMETEDTSGSWLDWASQMDKHYRILTKKTDLIEFGEQQEDELFIINYESLFTRNSSGKAGVNLKDKVMKFISHCTGDSVAIIIDESHKMKDTSSLQTKAIYKIKKDLEARHNKVYCYLATGTPYTRDFIDLYSQLKFLGCQMTKTEFIDKYCIRGNVPGLLGWQQPIVAYKNIDDLFGLVHRYAITMKSSDVIKLPEQIFIDHPLPSPGVFRRFTSPKIAEGSLDKTTSTKMVPNPYYRNIAYPDLKWFADTSANFYLRSRQLSIGFQGNATEFEWYDKSRLEAIESFLGENPDNYLLFYNYTPELIELYDICERLGYNIDIYCGEIKSLTYYEKFQNQSAGERLTNTKNIILSNWASGSTGMNWQLYNKCIIASLPVYKDYEQGLKRLHRIGQTNTVVYHTFYQKNFLDRKMMKALKDKQEYTKEMFEYDLANTSCEEEELALDKEKGE